MKMILFALLLSFSAHAEWDAEDIDVDWQPSNEKNVHNLRIVVNGCKTIFKIKNKDFAAAANDDQALTDALAKAIARSSSGCSN